MSWQNNGLVLPAFCPHFDTKSQAQPPANAGNPDFQRQKTEHTTSTLEQAGPHPLGWDGISFIRVILPLTGESTAEHTIKCHIGKV